MLFKTYLVQVLDYFLDNYQENRMLTGFPVTLLPEGAARPYLIKLQMKIRGKQTTTRMAIMITWMSLRY
jgi:hypothetical protein